MPETASTNPNPESRWPGQIKFIVGNEACERFSYYGMRSILAGYITGAVMLGGLGQTEDKSTEIIHLFVSANYFMHLLGFVTLLCRSWSPGVQRFCGWG